MYFSGLILFAAIIMYSKKKFFRAPTTNFKITNTSNIDAINEKIEKIVATNDKYESTYHSYINEIPYIQNNTSIVIDEIKQHIGQHYQPIYEINEVYMTALKSSNSDLSFVRLHSDSPYHFCSTYRVLVCINPNTKVNTIIPDDNINTTMSKYEILGFDYANTLHYIVIDNKEEIQNKRILLKLHFSDTKICNTLTKKYTLWARDLYVNNLNNITYYGNIMLITQFISSYMLYFILLLSTVLYLKQYNIRNKLFVYCESLCVFLMCYHIGFQVYFIFL